jgi:hypothetical protein
LSERASLPIFGAEDLAKTHTRLREAAGVARDAEAKLRGLRYRARELAAQAASPTATRILLARQQHAPTTTTTTTSSSSSLWVRQSAGSKQHGRTMFFSCSLRMISHSRLTHHR